MIRTAFSYITLFFASGLFVFPVAWMMWRAFDVEGGIGLDNIIDVWNSELFGRYFLNSLIVSVGITGLNLIFCSMTGFYLARFQNASAKAVFTTVLVTLVIPAPVLMIPLYMIVNYLGWLDTYWALIIPWAVTPLGIFLMRQFFERIPSAVEESARMDGAGDYTILFRVLLPMARPALAVLAIYTFIQSWNQFLFPFLLVDSDVMRTLPVGLAFFHSYQDIDIRSMMAGATIASAPMIGAFLLFQEQIISGLTEGAVKE